MFAILIRRLSLGWTDFWFKPSSGRPEALFRIAYCLVLFFDLLGFSSEVPFWFSNQGIHPVTGYDWLFPSWAVEILYWTWLSVLVLLAFGCYTRILSVLNFILLVYFFGLRGYAAPHAADWIYHSMGFYLLWMDSGRHLALRPNKSTVPPRIWPLRLAQLNFVSFYLTAGISKLTDPYWINGVALEELLKNPALSYFRKAWLDHLAPALPGDLFPFLAAMVEGGQVLLPLLLWFRKLRKWSALMLAFFQLSIILLLKVSWLGEMAMACLFLFFDELFPRRASPPSQSSGTRVTRSLVTVFLCLHFYAWAWALVHYIEGQAAGRRAFWQVFLKNRLLGTYALMVARMTYFDLVPSAFFTRPTRAVTGEVVWQDGSRESTGPITLEKPVPGSESFHGIRSGLLALWIPHRGLTLRQWQTYANSLLQHFLKKKPGTCPHRMEIQLLHSSDSSTFEVSKVFSAPIDTGCTCGKPDFTLTGKRLLLQKPAPFPGF